MMARTILSLLRSARMSATYSDSGQLAIGEDFFLGQKMAIREVGPKYEQGQGMAEKQAGLHRKKVQLYQECINILLHRSTREVQNISEACRMELCAKVYFRRGVTALARMLLQICTLRKNQ